MEAKISSLIVTQFTCQAKADPVVLRREAADDSWFTCPGLRKPLFRTHQEQGSPITPEGLHIPLRRTLPLLPGHRLQAPGRDHRAQEDRAGRSICSPRRELGSWRERGAPQLFAWTSLAPSGPWSAGPPLTSEHGDVIHPPVLVPGALTQHGAPVPPSVSCLGPFQPQRVVSQQFEPGFPSGLPRVWGGPGHLDVGH